MVLTEIPKVTGFFLLMDCAGYFYGVRITTISQEQCQAHPKRNSLTSCMLTPKIRKAYMRVSNEASLRIKAEHPTF